MASAELLQQIEDGNLHKRIPISSYQEQIKPIFETLSKIDISIKFDPKKHLAFKSSYLQTIKRTTMEEFGTFAKDQISNIGASEPFPLFTEEAVEIMRAEILREEVFTKWSRVSYNSTTGLDCVIRGYAKYTSPFTYAAWTHPDTVAAISSMAGVELEVIMDYEVAHINIAMKSQDLAKNEKINEKRKLSIGGSKITNDDIPAVVGWHNDSYPFVCVLMLSDTSSMIGGETLVKTGNGEIIPVSGPAKGKATVLQGRKLLHLASIPLGYTERITSVTSYRAKNSMLPETSVLKTVKPECNWGSLYDEFYPEWINYRMNVISDRSLEIKKIFNNALENGEKFDKLKAFELLQDLENYTANTWKEMQVSEAEYATHSKFDKENEN
ncbi:hypothetical protein CANARDRAFT_177577 [[Candida] arabinofermentans NRRL YB-2248]|uniref:Fe2OG dioxygenase domain-containing protein n=1 Tax=[Candida] arabinofermentans NRRL YB-2248 TaxID=983967 RepID=A0A1E4SW37_9ASCO|nr:hypothetical protein CANARDRAFT_177577 [[Candida] arabinofermentans NRRL YB-2248]